MDFFNTNNLNRLDFISYLSAWEGKDNWSDAIQGYPSLRFDLLTQNLFLHFHGLGSIKDVQIYKLNDFKFSINQRRHVLLLEFNDSLVDLALSFKKTEFCVKFKTLIIHYVQIREFIRKKVK